MGKINIEKYFEENNGMLFPAEFTISLAISDQGLMDEISGDYDLLSFQSDQEKIIVSLPSKRSMIEGAADQINNLIDRIKLLPQNSVEELSSDISVGFSDEYSSSSESTDDYQIINDYSGKDIICRINPEKDYGADNLRFKSTSRMWVDKSGDEISDEAASPEEVQNLLDQELSPEMEDFDLQTGTLVSDAADNGGISEISGIVLPDLPPGASDFLSSDSHDSSFTSELSQIAGDEAADEGFFGDESLSSVTPEDDLLAPDAGLEDADNFVLPDLPEGGTDILLSEEGESEIMSDLMPVIDEIEDLDIPDEIVSALGSVESPVPADSAGPAISDETEDSDYLFEFESLSDLPDDASESLASELDESEIMSDLSSDMSIPEEEDFEDIAVPGDFADLGETEAVAGYFSADSEVSEDISLSAESEDYGSFEDLSDPDAFGDLGDIEGAEEISFEENIGLSPESEDMNGFEDLDFEIDDSISEKSDILTDDLSGDFTEDNFTEFSVESDLATKTHRTGYNSEESLPAETPDEISLPSVSDMEDSADEFSGDKEEYYRKITEINPSDSLGWSGLGTVLAKKGIAEEAEYAFNQAVNLDFNNEEALMGLFFILKGRGCYNEAVEFINVLIRKKPWDSSLLYEKAVVEEMTGNMSGAERELKKAVILDPENTLAWAKMALILVKNGKNEEALECYSELTRLKPEVSEVWYSKGLVLKSLHRCEESLSSFEKCLEINPADDDALKEKAGILLSEGNYIEAVKEYEKGLSNNPESTWALSGLASSYENLDLNEKALDVYDTILSINPAEISALEGKAELLLKSHLFAEAKDTYISISSLEPDNPDIWLTIAKLSENSGLYDEAMDAYNHVLKLDPGNPDGLRGRIRVLVSQGRYEESIADYNFLIVQNPSDASLIADKAIACIRTGRHDEAIVLYNAALNLDRSNSKILMELIDLLTSLGRLEETLPVYDKLISLMPEETDLLLSKGLILAGVKRHREAVSCFNRVIAKKPGDPEVMLNMGVSLLCLGERKKALRCYKKSLEADPEFGNRWLESGITAASFLMTKEPDIVSISDNYRHKEDNQVVRRGEITKKDVSDLYDSPYLSSGEDTDADYKDKPVDVDIQPDRFLTQVSYRRNAGDEQNDPDELVRKGIELTKSGFYDIAEESLLRAVGIDDYSEPGYFSLGVLYGKTERYNEAIECFEKVLMINPSNKKAGRGIIMARNKI